MWCDLPRQDVRPAPIGIRVLTGLLGAEDVSTIAPPFVPVDFGGNFQFPWGSALTPINLDPNKRRSDRLKLAPVRPMVLSI